ncbi:MAG: DMT family transporter [Pirellulales bacterium]
MTSQAPWPSTWVAAATVASLIAFAGNSLLCRQALSAGALDPATFTGIRLVAGAVVLLAIVVVRRQPAGGPRLAGSWTAAAALFVYAAGFSWAYQGMTAGTGALLLFGSVQTTMVAWAVLRGERPRRAEWLGFAAAGVGLGVLLAPKLAPPPWSSAAAMMLAGAAWGVYSLRGRGTTDPTGATAGNFLRASLLALPWMWWSGRLPLGVATGQEELMRGALLAVISGAATSGLGYVVWYAALRGLSATRAALVQLSVPVLAALGGVAFLRESFSTTLALSTGLVLGGVAWAIYRRRT